MSEGLVIHGERYVNCHGASPSSTACASSGCRGVQYGLLEPVEHVDGELAIAGACWTAWPCIQRLSVLQGVNLPGIAIILDLMERAP
jgi:hypothetical protein